MNSFKQQFAAITLSGLLVAGQAGATGTNADADAAAWAALTADLDLDVSAGGGKGGNGYGGQGGAGGQGVGTGYGGESNSGGNIFNSLSKLTSWSFNAVQTGTIAADLPENAYDCMKGSSENKGWSAYIGGANKSTSEFGADTDCVTAVQAGLTARKKLEENGLTLRADMQYDYEFAKAFMTDHGNKRDSNAPGHRKGASVVDHAIPIAYIAETSTEGGIAVAKVTTAFGDLTKGKDQKAKEKVWTQDVLVEAYRVTCEEKEALAAKRNKQLGIDVPRNPDACKKADPTAQADSAGSVAAPVEPGH